MNLLILKSNIDSRKGVRQVARVLDSHPAIKHWTVDLDDIDKVLRIEWQHFLSAVDIQRLLKPIGYHCENLPD